jgi:hypothetical protein
MKKQVFAGLILVLSVAIVSCTSTKKLSKNEDFESFNKKFYKDSSFQYSRIHFPLELVEYMGNIKQDPESEYQSNVETNQLTEKTLPRMIKSIDDYPDMYKRKLDTTKTGIDEKIFIPNSGYIETRSFILDGKKWYLRHINIMNL